MNKIHQFFHTLHLRDSLTYGRETLHVEIFFAKSKKENKKIFFFVVPKKCVFTEKKIVKLKIRERVVIIAKIL